ncbi:IS4 family transposase [Streptomyces sp. NBC_00631]|uniref:IS4 family transposase n=1 Tax=Streptomyces sp. NBC_00631 TaxID=2975793 RepID=UPI0030E0AD75
MSADVGELSGLGLLTWVYPSGLVDRAVAACGRAEQRRRLLPARLMVYFVLGLALFSPAPYLEVMRHLVEGLRGQGLLGDWPVPAKSSLFRARQRLGPEPLRVLFTTTAKPMGTESTPGAFWRGLRLLAVDGTCWDVADSPANEAAFGRPGNSRGHDKSSFPQVRMACLTEVGTHLVLDAELAGCRTGEVTLVGRLPRSCGPGQLVLADREFLGVPLWRAFTAAGADLLGRVPVNRVLPVDRILRDGSWLSRIHAHTDPAHSDPVTVRVLAYRLNGTGRAGEDYRLVTSLLDARRHPARQLAALYQERWEAEAVFAELKTHQRGARVVISSKTPDGVLQQIWAHLLVHHALRELMVRTAATRGLDPDQSPSPRPCALPGAA